MVEILTGKELWLRPVFQQASICLFQVVEAGFSYRGSVNYVDQQGVVINSGRKQLGLHFVAQQKALNDKLVIQYSILNVEYYQKTNGL